MKRHFGLIILVLALGSSFLRAFDLDEAVEVAVSSSPNVLSAAQATIDDLRDAVWGYDDVHIAWFRQIFADAPHPNLILTVRGRGYYFAGIELWLPVRGTSHQSGNVLPSTQ